MLTEVLLVLFKDVPKCITAKLDLKKDDDTKQRQMVAYVMMILFHLLKVLCF